MVKGKKIDSNLSGGYVGEKEIKSAGNKIYKIIHSPEAQTLGKVALTTLITAAIGSTIKSGMGKTPTEPPAVGAPLIEQQPDIYDSNPMLHFTGLGLKEDANKALKGIKSKYDTDISPAVKSAGDKIYKLITSPEAQSLGKAGLGLLILLAIGSQGEKIAKFGNEMENVGQDFTQKHANITIGKNTERVPSGTFNIFPKNDWEPPPEPTPESEAGKAYMWAMMLDTIHKINEAYREKNRNASASGLIKKHPIIRDIHDHVKGGMFDKTKKTLKSVSDKIYKTFTSPTAQKLGKVALTLLLAKAVTKAIPAAVVASEEISKRSAEHKYRQAFDKRAEAWERERENDAHKRGFDEAFSADTSHGLGDTFSHFAGFGLPKRLHEVANAHHPHLDKLSSKMADSIEYLIKCTNSKRTNSNLNFPFAVNKKYLPFLISKILSAGVLIAKGGKVSTEKEEKKEHQTIWTKYIKPTTDKIYDVATSDEVKTSVKGVIYLLLTLIVADQVNKLGVAINRGLVETLATRRDVPSQASRDLFNLGMSDVDRVPEGYKGEEFPKWDDNTDQAYRARVLSALENKYKSDRAEEKHTKDALLKLSKDLGVSVSAKQVGRPQGSLGKSRPPVRIPAVAVAKEESKDGGLGLFHGGDFQNDTARMRTAISDSATKFKNQLNKLYRDIKSEYGKKMTKNALLKLALASLAIAGTTGAVVSGLSNIRNPSGAVLQRRPVGEDYDTRMYEEGFRDFL
jgi:hypothetical protein